MPSGTSLYDTILAFLTAQWNIATETDPAFKNYKKISTDTWTENVVGIEVLEQDGDYHTLSGVHGANQIFILHCMCKTEALRDKYITEIKRLMPLQTSIVGWWKWTNVTWDDATNFSHAKVTCMEHKLE